ncbi:hypothetical protein DSECCO2_578070 [anaerobic digester metagenome]
MNIAVFAWAQSVSPAEIVPVFFAMSEMSFQIISISMLPRTPIPKSMPAMSFLRMA